MDWKFGVSRCKLSYIEWINNKVLLYGTGNYIQYHEISDNGKEYEKGCVYIYIYPYICMDFPGGSDGKASAYNTGDPGSIPGSEGSPGEGNGNSTPVLLPGKIPWTEDPGRLQSMGSQSGKCPV